MTHKCHVKIYSTDEQWTFWRHWVSFSPNSVLTFFKERRFLVVVALKLTSTFKCFMSDLSWGINWHIHYKWPGFEEHYPPLLYYINVRLNFRIVYQMEILFEQKPINVCSVLQALIFLFFDHLWSVNTDNLTQRPHILDHTSSIVWRWKAECRVTQIPKWEHYRGLWWLLG